MAFRWECDGSVNPVVFHSVGFMPGKGLRDLVLAGPSWKAMYVQLWEFGSPVGISPGGAWWTNPIVSLPGAAGAVQTLATSGSVYVASSSMSVAGYNINADKISIVTLAGLKLTFDGTGAYTCSETSGESTATTRKCLIASGSQKFLWIEADLDGNIGTPIDYGILFVSTAFSVIHGTTVKSATFSGLSFDTSSANTISETSAVSNNTGITLGNFSAKNLLTDLRIANSLTGHGLEMVSGVSQNYVINYSSSNNAGSGIYLSNSTTTDNIFVNGVVANNGSYGVSLTVTADKNNFQQLTTANNFYDNFYISGTNSNTLVNILSMNAGNAGLNIQSSSGNRVAHVFAENNFSNGVFLSSANANIFTETLALYNNDSGGSFDPCYVAGGTTPGLISSTCTDSGADNSSTYTGNSSSSTATLRTSLDFLNSIYGEASTDGVNSSHSAGTSVFASILDWIQFDNRFRLWGRDGTASVFDASHRANCAGGNTCRIWDFRLAVGDGVLRNSNGAFSQGTSCPATASGSRTTTDSQSTSKTYLTFATEIVGDGIGNDNGLCESNETCIYSPNVGAYQGEESSLSTGSCTFSGGTVNNVIMLGYTTNGG